MTPAETVSALIRACEERDLDAVCSLVSDDIEYDNVPIGTVHGPDGVRSVLSGGVTAAATLTKLRYVGARHKGFFASAGQHNQADIVVVDAVLDVAWQTHPHVVIHGVELGLVVKHDGAHVALFVQVDGAGCGGGFVAHGQMTFCCLS